VWSPRPLPPPGLARTRIKGVVLGALTGAVAALLHLWHRPLSAGIAAGLATLELAVALLAPRRHLARIDAALATLTGLVGRVAAWVILAPIFYLVVAPIGRWRRRGGRDPLARHPGPAPTYWAARDPRGDDPGTYGELF
jgi:hypothetical protein